MAAPVIDSLPPAPLESDSKTEFNEKAFAFVAALNPFGQQINAFGEYLTPTGAATLPLAGTETVTIEQGGERKTLAVSELSGGGGGLTNLTENKNTSAPNETIPVVSLTATGAESDIDLTLSPKGYGAFSLQVADNTTAGGNKRGGKAVDLQLIRETATEVASGYFSFIGGGNANTASATYATVSGGNRNRASGTNSWIPGGTSCLADGPLGTASGGFATTRGVRGCEAHSVVTFNSDKGSAQRRIFDLSNRTTDGTSRVLLTDHLGGSGILNINLPNNNSLYHANGRVTAFTSALDVKVWEVDVTVIRGVGVDTVTLVGTPVKNELTATAGSSAWDLDFDVDTTNGYLDFVVTGVAATTISWRATIVTTETTI